MLDQERMLSAAAAHHARQLESMDPMPLSVVLRDVPSSCSVVPSVLPVSVVALRASSIRTIIQVFNCGGQHALLMHLSVAAHGELNRGLPMALPDSS